MNLFNSKFAGREAGTRHFRRGGKPHAIVVDIRFPDEGKSIQVGAHRIALVMSGVNLGNLDGDHKNGNPFDNRLENLRPATAFESSRNRGKFTKSSGLPKGVNRNRDVFVARIGGNGETYLGTFKTAHEAAVAYQNAARQKYKDFARV